MFSTRPVSATSSSSSFNIGRLFIAGATLAFVLPGCAGASDDGEQDALLEAESDLRTREVVEARASRVVLRSGAAQSLYAGLRAAGADETFSGGRRFLSLAYATCATDGLATTCVLDGQGKRSATGTSLSGARLSSAASTLFGVVAALRGESPQAVSSVEHGWFACSKTSSVVSCTIDAAVLVDLDLDRLDVPGEGFVYEGWAVAGGVATSTGRFADTNRKQAQAFPRSKVSGARYVLTLEPRRGDDPKASDVHVLAGDLDDRGEGALSVSHASALGTDFANAAGGYILQTPSTMRIADDYAQGLWFVDPSGPKPSLSLPALPKGWVYEGWVVTNDGPISTGRFTSPAGADDDRAGKTAGPDATGPFPGQDFIDPAISLVGKTIVISVEPAVDDSPKPFAIKPLIDEVVTDVGPGVLQPLATKADGLPSGSLARR